MDSQKGNANGRCVKKEGDYLNQGEAEENINGFYKKIIMSYQYCFAWWNSPEYMERPKIGSRNYKKESEVYYGRKEIQRKKEFRKKETKDNNGR